MCIPHSNVPQLSWGMLQYTKVHSDLFKELVCCFLSFDGLFTRHEDAHIYELVNYHK
jgi:hypothetical protein